MLGVLGLNLRTNKSSKQEGLEISYIGDDGEIDHMNAHIARRGERTGTMSWEEKAIKVNGSIKARRLG